VVYKLADRNRIAIKQPADSELIIENESCLLFEKNHFVSSTLVSDKYRRPQELKSNLRTESHPQIVMRPADKYYLITNFRP
jgi:hypothetical protein